MGCIALAISLASFPAPLSGTSILKVPRKARKLFDATAWRDPLFLVFTASSFVALWVTSRHIIGYAVSNGDDKIRKIHSRNFMLNSTPESCTYACGLQAQLCGKLLDCGRFGGSGNKIMFLD
jgi:hypothetical protein